MRTYSWHFNTEIWVSETVTQQLKYLAARAPRVIASSSGVTHKDKKQRKELRLRVQKSTGGKTRSKLRKYYSNYYYLY